MQGRAVGTREREQLLEETDPPHEQVDVVDVAAGRRALALHLDLVLERLRTIRHEEEVVGGKPPEDEGGDEPEHAEHDRRAGEALHARVTTGRA